MLQHIGGNRAEGHVLVWSGTPDRAEGEVLACAVCCSTQPILGAGLVRPSSAQLFGHVLVCVPASTATVSSPPPSLPNGVDGAE